MEKEAKKRNYAVNMLVRLVKEKPLGAAGAVVLLVLLLVGVFANVLAPYGYNDMDLSARLSPSSPAHILGTDNLGRDLLSRIIYGARISMIVGFSVALIGTALAAVLGIISGYFGGAVDFVIQRFVDGMMCLPSLIVVLTVVAITGPGLLPIILVLGVEGGVGGRVRVVRGAVIAIKRNLYVEASRSIGATSLRTMAEHILPNVMAPVIVMFTTSLGSAIITEATLSFIGLGIPPPEPSWGGMLSLSGRSFMLIAPWMAFWPGLCLCVAVYGVNVLGDALRDLLDPRLEGGSGSYKIKKMIGGGFGGGIFGRRRRQKPENT
ncbi:MAG: ABC transporter permease [Clostridiales bacterium]|nr:ABC transporter permease [Clostridiales bacterium]